MPEAGQKPELSLYQNFSSDVDVFFGAGCVDARVEEIVSCEEGKKIARQKRCIASAGNCCAVKVGDACQEA